jgi:DNA-binding GntR family transcriptional regulator
MAQPADRVTSPGFQPSEKLSEAVLRHIAGDIVAGRLKPNQHLAELKLCEELGVSRSPVREAIHRLAVEGLVVLVPRKGAFVADLSAKEVSDVFEVRSELEALTARLAAAKATPRDVAELEAVNRRCAEAAEAESFAEFFDHNDAFHRSVGDIAGNDYLQQLRQAAATRTFRPLFLYLSSPEHMLSSVREHDELIGAIAAGRAADAERTVRGHLDSARREAIALVEQARQTSAGS